MSNRVNLPEIADQQVYLMTVLLFKNSSCRIVQKIWKSPWDYTRESIQLWDSFSQDQQFRK